MEYELQSSFHFVKFVLSMKSAKGCMEMNEDTKRTELICDIIYIIGSSPLCLEYRKFSPRSIVRKDKIPPNF